MGRAPDGSVCVGAIAGAFGVRGEVRLKSFCADPAAIADYGPLTTEAGQSFPLRLTRPVKGGFAARLEGVGSREAAEALRGTRLYAPRDRLPDPGEDEFYHTDLIGLSVLDPGGGAVGSVRAVHDHGAGDILDIARPDGSALLIPFTRAHVPNVDLAAGVVIVDPADEKPDAER
ncbi:MAG: ribosome maturation factor RimM [Pseudomonadota bacterium]